MQRFPFARSLALSVVFLTAPTWAQISWSTRLDQALDQARSRETILAIAITMPGERGSDAVEKHYEDGRLGEVSNHTVNLWIRVGPSGDGHPDEREVFRRFLEAGPDTDVTVPHHLFVDPTGDGRVVRSAAWQVTRGQLEWIWVDAIRTVRDFEWELAEDARAPESLRIDGADAGAPTPPPPSPEEVDNAIKELKKSGRIARARDPRLYELWETVLRSDEPSAIKFGLTSLKSLNGFFLARILRIIAASSPPDWWTVAAEYVDHREDNIREEAIRALESLGDERAVRSLQKQWKLEKDDALRGRILRALAAVAPSKSSVVRTIEKVIEKERSEVVRRQAVAAVSVLEDDSVPDLIRKGLRDDDPLVSAAAAWAAATRRADDLLGDVEAVATGTGGDAKRWLDTAVEVLRGGEPKELAPFARDVLDDRVRGDPEAFRGPPDRRGG